MKKRSVVLLAILALGLTIVPAAVAGEAQAGLVQKGAYNSYVVIMKADPLVVTHRGDVNSAKAKSRGQELKASHNKTLREAGLANQQIVNDYTVALNGFSALINHAQAEALAANKNVLMVLPDELLQAQTDESGDFLGLTGAGGAYASGVKGKGVVVGIIDTGIWPEHPSFADNGLPTPTGIAAGIPCEFGNTGTVPGHHNVNDVAFACQDKLLGARQMLATYRAAIGAAPDEFDSARDDSGHGSHTASTSAGNAGVSANILGSPVGDGTISGIAPEASIIAYKGLGNQGGFSSDLAAAINQAVADGVDVINYSIGGGGGILGADDIAMLLANDAGVFVAASAGNSGPGTGNGTVGSPGDNPWLIGVAASTQERFLQGTVKLGNGANYTGASVTNGTAVVGLIDAAAATTNGDDLCQSAAVPAGQLQPALVTGKIVLCRRGVNARVDKSLAVKNAGGVGMIMYENSDTGNLFTDTHWLPTVHIDNTPGLAIKAYAATPGATAQITNTRAIASWPIAPSMTDFSSRGPSAYQDTLKPDITAPGLQILAGGSPFPDAGSVPGELFQAIAGTSMSSPHVAGLLALLKQANPAWSASAAKSALMTTAYQTVLDNDRINPADPFDMGAGHANPGQPGQKGSAFQPGLVYDAGLNDYLAWMCGASPANINPATCVALAGAGYSLDPSDLNLASIAVAQLAGSQTVTRTVTSVAKENGWRKYTASFQAPAGYSVSVSPSSFQLKTGMSQTLQITIVNNSAPLNTWRFGSMTLSDQTGHYSARSPIAVRASQFDAPAEINGEGASGSESFDVKFGYSGDYDAAAIGLVPAVLDSRVVVQDPNQAFSRTDGFSQDHAIALVNAAVLRVVLPASSTEANADLDIYLYNPAGVQVASSTAGSGSDEAITIHNPVNGTWHLWVHGWQTIGPDSPYTLYSFNLPAAPEDTGSLQVTSEPANAVIGTVGTINVSWTGATIGQWWLGAVTHKTGATVMGRTLINVDNR